jgi:hypothetical protein
MFFLMPLRQLPPKRGKAEPFLMPASRNTVARCKPAVAGSGSGKGYRKRGRPAASHDLADLDSVIATPGPQGFCA